MRVNLYTIEPPNRDKHSENTLKSLKIVGDDLWTYISIGSFGTSVKYRRSIKLSASDEVRLAIISKGIGNVVGKFCLDVWSYKWWNLDCVCVLFPISRVNSNGYWCTSLDGIRFWRTGALDAGMEKQKFQQAVQKIWTQTRFDLRAFLDKFPLWRKE